MPDLLLMSPFPFIKNTENFDRNSEELAATDTTTYSSGEMVQTVRD